MQAKSVCLRGLDYIGRLRYFFYAYFSKTHYDEFTGIHIFGKEVFDVYGIINMKDIQL